MLLKLTYKQIVVNHDGHCSDPEEYYISDRDKYVKLIISIPKIMKKYKIPNIEILPNEYKEFWTKCEQGNGRCCYGTLHRLTSLEYIDTDLTPLKLTLHYCNTNDKYWLTEMALLKID